MTPTKALRIFFDQNEELRPFATQKGFADLIGRSESMIRAMEGSRAVKMSPTLARRISTLTGVSQEWLMAPDAGGIDIPSFEGLPLRHDAVIARINRQIDRNLRLAVNGLADGAGENTQSPPESFGSFTNRRLAALTAKMFENYLFADLERGDSRLMEEITKLLDRDGDSRDRKVAANHPASGPDGGAVDFPRFQSQDSPR